MKKCTECGAKLRSLSHGKRHWRNAHSGTVETPEEYLNVTESEQRDFAGGEPTTDGHNPEYEVTNDSAETKTTTLFEHERENDANIQEYNDGGKE